ncbi:hypothetical protein BC629DRAFT_1579886 [Irpex lacteus]|nr:hypothetical protein BC629DRAFT_1579886 [Irpex lacteus]
METVKNVAERMAGTAANGYHQSDVTDLSGRTALVTGGTGGIGFEVAKAFAWPTQSVPLITTRRECRRGSDEDQRSVVYADVHFVQCDLGNMATVRSVADKLREQEPRMDIVVCDAGVGVNSYAESSDGIDRHMAVNHLGHVLLTSRLPNTPPPRIVTVSSELHRAAPSDVAFASLEELNDPSLSAWLCTAARSSQTSSSRNTVSKGAYSARTRMTSSRSLCTPETCTQVNKTSLRKHMGHLWYDHESAVIPFMRNPDQGSLSTLWAATSDDVEKNRVDFQGKYFNDPGVLGGESKQGCDPELGARLWTLTEKLIREKGGQDALLPWDEGSEKLKTK